MKQMLIVLCLITGTAVAQETTVTPLISKELTGIPGKEATIGPRLAVDWHHEVHRV